MLGFSEAKPDTPARLRPEAPPAAPAAARRCFPLEVHQRYFLSSLGLGLDGKRLSSKQEEGVFICKWGYRWGEGRKSWLRGRGDPLLTELTPRKSRTPS